MRVSGEGTWRVDDRVALAVTAGRAPGSFLRGIAADPTPAESFLAIEWIESRTGRGGISELTKRVAAGDPFSRALARSVGLEERGIAAALRRHAELMVRGRVSDENVATFRKALAAHRKGDLDAASGNFQRLASREKPHALQETSRYLLARTLVDQSSFRRAHGLLGQALAQGRELLWEPEILEQSGICALGLNRRREADRYFHEVLERFPEDRAVVARVERRLDGLRKGRRAER